MNIIFDGNITVSIIERNVVVIPCNLCCAYICFVSPCYYVVKTVSNNRCIVNVAVSIKECKRNSTCHRFPEYESIDSIIRVFTCICPVSHTVLLQHCVTHCKRLTIQ